MVAAVREVGLPARLSNTAGTFVCNQLLYGLLHAGLRAGFIHVPYAPDQGEPSLPVAETARGLEAAVGALAASLGGER